MKDHFDRLSRSIGNNSKVSVQFVSGGHSCIMAIKKLSSLKEKIFHFDDKMKFLIGVEIEKPGDSDSVKKKIKEMITEVDPIFESDFFPVDSVFIIEKEDPFFYVNNFLCCSWVVCWRSKHD